MSLNAVFGANAICRIDVSKYKIQHYV